MGEPVVYLTAAGIRVKLRPIERAALQKEGPDGNGSFGNAATRIEALVIGGGTYVYGSDADVDGLFREPAPTEIAGSARHACTASSSSSSTTSRLRRSGRTS
jgi:hypothetical protein